MRKGKIVFFTLWFLLFSLNVNCQRNGKSYDNKAKYQETVNRLFSIVIAIRNYSYVFDSVPEAHNIHELERLLKDYIKNTPRDAWGNDFIYKFEPRDPQHYLIASSGSDGKFEGFDQVGQWNGFAGQDIIFKNAPPFWIYAPTAGDIRLPDASNLVVKIERYLTRLNDDKTLGIVRHPSNANFSFIHKKKLESLPFYNPDSKNNWQIDLRSTDISALDLRDRTKDLLYATYDSKTRWPQKLPTGFNPVLIMDLGLNPGLGIRKLHQQGLTGKGISIAIIDQGLLVDHVEYSGRLRLYEEMHSIDSIATMHGAAVASIAVGKSLGVAPEADLYFIAETHGIYHGSIFEWDLSFLAQAVDRILEIDRRLPATKRIKVISISLGWRPGVNGYRELVGSIERAKQAGIFIVSSSLSSTYGPEFKFQGLGREPTSDPDRFESYAPGLWWSKDFFSNYEAQKFEKQTLLIPMDSRCVASPTGNEDYIFYREGGWSWCIPYIAGMYALACQANSKMTPRLFWQNALLTGKTVQISRKGQVYQLGKIVDPIALMESLKK